MSASFTRTDVAEGAKFVVTPSRSSLGAPIFAGIFSAIFIAIGAWWWLALLLPAPLWLFFVWDFRKRKKVTFLATKDALVVDGKKYPGNDIAELIVKSPGGQATSVSYNTVAVGTTPGAFAAAAAMNVASSFQASGQRAGQALAAEHNARSSSLYLRRRSTSKPILLMFGLDADTGQALMDDLLEAMR